MEIDQRLVVVFRNVGELRVFFQDFFFIFSQNEESEEKLFQRFFYNIGNENVIVFKGIEEKIYRQLYVFLEGVFYGLVGSICWGWEIGKLISREREVRKGTWDVGFEEKGKYEGF